jgi:uncharacterized phage infection (PIP) family protein YhgE
LRRNFEHPRQLHIHMKPLIYSLLIALPLATCAWAAPEEAPFINKQIKALTQQISDDLAAGKLTQSDADQLKGEVKHVQDVLDNEPSLTPKTRRDLREDLSKIDKDLERKEAEAKAMASPSASP